MVNRWKTKNPKDEGEGRWIEITKRIKGNWKEDVGKREKRKGNPCSIKKRTGKASKIKTGIGEIREVKKRKWKAGKRKKRKRIQVKWKKKVGKASTYKVGTREIREVKKRKGKKWIK